MNTFKMKSVIKLATIVFSVFFLSISSFFFFRQRIAQNIIHEKIGILATGENTNEQDINIESFLDKQGFPVRLKIPSLGVDANIQHVGFNSAGEMDVPDNTDTLGWFAFGPRPGEKGSSVIAGHLYGENGVPGVFANLSNIAEGDKIYIDDSKGKTITFIARRQRIYDPGFVLDVFDRTDNHYLNLVTCDGDWDITKESYTKRLVVFADIDN